MSMPFSEPAAIKPDNGFRLIGDFGAAWHKVF